MPSKPTIKQVAYNLGCQWWVGGKMENSSAKVYLPHYVRANRQHPLFQSVLSSEIAKLAASVGATGNPVSTCYNKA